MARLAKQITSAIGAPYPGRALPLRKRLRRYDDRVLRRPWTPALTPRQRTYNRAPDPMKRQGKPYTTDRVYRQRSEGSDAGSPRAAHRNGPRWA